MLLSQITAVARIPKYSKLVFCCYTILISKFVKTKLTYIDRTFFCRHVRLWCKGIEPRMLGKDQRDQEDPNYPPKQRRAEPHSHQLIPKKHRKIRV